MSEEQIIHHMHYIIDLAYTLNDDFDLKQAKDLNKDTVAFNKRLLAAQVGTNTVLSDSNVNSFDNSTKIANFYSFKAVIDDTLTVLARILTHSPSTQNGYYMFIKNIISVSQNYKY